MHGSNRPMYSGLHVEFANARLSQKCSVGAMQMFAQQSSQDCVHVVFPVLSIMNKAVHDCGRFLGIASVGNPVLQGYPISTVFGAVLKCSVINCL